MLPVNVYGGVLGGEIHPRAQKEAARPHPFRKDWVRDPWRCANTPCRRVPHLERSSGASQFSKPHVFHSDSWGFFFLLKIIFFNASVYVIIRPWQGFVRTASTFHDREKVIPSGNPRAHAHTTYSLVTKNPPHRRV